MWRRATVIAALIGAAGLAACGDLFGSKGSNTSINQCGGDADKAPSPTVVDITDGEFTAFGHQLRMAAKLAEQRRGSLPIGSAADGVRGEVGELQTSDVLCSQEITDGPLTYQEVHVNQVGVRIIDLITQNSIAFEPKPEFPDKPLFFFDNQLTP